MRPAPTVVHLVTALLLLAAGCDAEDPADSSEKGSGVLELRFTDAETGAITAVRASVVGSDGRSRVPEQALGLAADCGWVPVHNWIPFLAPLQYLLNQDPTVHNPYLDLEQFYLDRPATLRLPAGSFEIRASKGPEYEVVRRTVRVETGRRTLTTVPMSRWIDMPGEGWYGADDHLHLARPAPWYDRRIASWMQAEDVHVANLLQMGFSNGMYITPQYGFGSDAIHRDGITILASGQENPRTHVLGHSIVLGSPRWIDHSHDYLAYDRFWREAEAAGAISGYAHWGLAGAGEGIALWGPHGYVDFLEVLGFGVPYYGVWYEMLDLGLRVTPTAGTDHPCSPDLPGRDRFYTAVDGPLDYGAWIDAVRRGRTFVTNGPMLDFEVGGAGIGATVSLAPGDAVRVRARVRFDPARDDVRKLEIVRAGTVTHSASERTAPGEIVLDVDTEFTRTGWIAARARGVKIGETPVGYAALLESYLSTLDWSWTDDLLERSRARGTVPRDGDPRPSAAHTAPVYVDVPGSPPLAARPESQAAAQAWVARLDALEARFAEVRLEEIAGFPGRGDGVPLEALEAQRRDLLAAVGRARAIYERWLARGGDAR